MRCLACQYDLSKLTELRCPECGRAFDPNDHHTFDGGPYLPAWRNVMKVGIIIFLIIFGLVFALNVLFLITRLMEYLSKGA